MVALESTNQVPTLDVDKDGRMNANIRALIS